MPLLTQFLIAAAIACGAILVGMTLAPRHIVGAKEEPERLPVIVPFELPIGNIEQPPAPLYDPSRHDH